MHRRPSGIPRSAIVLVPFPFTDLSGAKVRPALVLSTSNARGKDVVVAFISSKTAGAQKGEDVVIPDSDQELATTGLKVASTIRCRKLATLDRAIILGELGKLPHPLMERVDKTLLRTLGLA